MTHKLLDWCIFTQYCIYFRDGSNIKNPKHGTNQTSVTSNIELFEHLLKFWDRTRTLNEISNIGPTYLYMLVSESRSRYTDKVTFWLHTSSWEWIKVWNFNLNESTVWHLVRITLLSESLDMSWGRYLVTQSNILCLHNHHWDFYPNLSFDHMILPRDASYLVFLIGMYYHYV